MKMPIGWHRACLENRKASFKKEVEQWEVLKSRLNAERRGIQFYQFQVDQATREKKNGFDPEKYKKKLRESVPSWMVS